MAEKSFLDILQKSRRRGGEAGDAFGGAAGADGRGLPTNHPSNFMFATGIECSYPTIHYKGKTVRRDQMKECGHYDNLRRDLQLVKDLGLRVLRYGLPYYAISTGPGKYDWSFADEAMHELQRLEITPILDLLHFGVPDWIGDFQNPELPLHFANYARTVAKRYPWVRYWTPVNEIYVTARISALDGNWNERLKTPQGFVTAMKNIVAASILANQEIASVRPDCVIIQSESAEYTHEARAVPTPGITLKNKLRFLSLDLLYAHPMDSDVCMFLLDHGLTREEYEWFMKGEPPGYQIMGNDYYGRNEVIVLPDGGEIRAQDVLGWQEITREYYNRYRKPVMHTETNTIGEAGGADPVQWLWKQWMNVLGTRRMGVPVLGFTWYSLTDQKDWDTQLAELNDRVNPCGLYDLQRCIRPVGKAYQQLLREFGQITMVPHGEMFAISDQPARLKVEV